MNKRGIALITAFMVIVVLTILGAATFFQSISERLISQRYLESKRAFWLAEAGLSMGLAQLKVDFNNLNGIAATALGRGQYSVDPILVEGTNRRITSRGYIPSAAQPRAQRVITALAQGFGANPSNYGLINYAIETSGELRITGSVNLNPAGSSHEDSTLTFEQVFGMTEEEARALATRVYTDPPSNQQPVNGVTWVDLTESNKYSISSNWTGSGLLIVNGNGSDIALEISGDWIFSGMIWVKGKVKITGSPLITGAIFAESAIDVESFLSGDPTLNFSSSDISDAFGLLTQVTGVRILSWREI
ncbi:MAG: hypothetical protein WC301_04080 [Candidatus Omnitrophota bacterium]|jgi:hypothetical protein